MKKIVPPSEKMLGSKKEKKLCLKEEKRINVELAYAGRKHQILKKLKIPKGCTVEKAIFFSKILEEIKDLYLLEGRVGIFGKKVSLNSELKPGDRIEIYQPLYLDPKDARKMRADKQKSRRQKDKN